MPPTTHHTTTSPYQRAMRSQCTLANLHAAYLRDAYRQGFADGLAARASREDDEALDYSARQQLAYAIGHIVGSAQDAYDNPWRL